MAVSDRVKSGPEKAPHRSLWKALGLTDEELKLPLIGVVSAKRILVARRGGALRAENKAGLMFLFHSINSRSCRRCA